MQDSGEGDPRLSKEPIPRAATQQLCLQNKAEQKSSDIYLVWGRDHCPGRGRE